jgi:type VI secretion system protein ImpA
LKAYYVADIDQPAEQAGGGAPLDRKLAALCTPFSDADPCGPDLDLEGDPDYLNFLANAEGVLPTTFFSVEDGSPFDPTTVDIAGQLEAIKPLVERTRDLRLLILQARLSILNRDLGGFALNLAATAWWLDKFWDAVHPRLSPGDNVSRSMVIATLELPTVIFPMQYAPLLEAERLGAISYRTWMIAAGEVKPRTGDIQLTQSAITNAIGAADPEVLATTRRHITLVKTSLDSIRSTFYAKGDSAGLEKLPALVKSIQEFIDPQASAPVADAAAGAGGADSDAAAATVAAGAAPASLSQAREALAAIADYYARSEPSSPVLPLVLQAHLLVGKSFFEVMTIMIPSYVDKAVFRIGTDKFFDLPLNKLWNVADGLVVPADGEGSLPEESAHPQPVPQYTVASRPQAIALLGQVNQYFRRFEPSSPVPMLCERALALVGQNFMDVLKGVLPKDALKNPP